MSRRKDLARYEAMQRLDSEYVGFRGYAAKPNLQAKTTLKQITCSRCKRKRNISPEMLTAPAEQYICKSCQDQEIE